MFCQKDSCSCFRRVFVGQKQSEAITFSALGNNVNKDTNANTTNPSRNNSNDNVFARVHAAPLLAPLPHLLRHRRRQQPPGGAILRPGAAAAAVITGAAVASGVKAQVGRRRGHAGRKQQRRGRRCRDAAAEVNHLLGGAGVSPGVGDRPLFAAQLRDAVVGRIGQPEDAQVRRQRQGNANQAQVTTLLTFPCGKQTLNVVPPPGLIFSRSVA